MPADTIRIGLMSDLHIEFEADYWDRLQPSGAAW